MILQIYKSFFRIFMGLLFLSSCASVEPEEATPSHLIKKVSADENKRVLPQIKKRIKNAKKEEAIEILNSYRRDYKGTEFETEIDLMTAQEHQKNERWHDAGTSFLRAARSVGSFEKKAQYCLLASRSYQKATEWEVSLKAVDYCIKKLEVPNQYLTDLKISKIAALEFLNLSKAEIVKSYVDIMANSKGETESRYRNLAIQTVETKLNSDELIEVISNSDFGFVRGYAYYRLARLSLEKSDSSNAKIYLSKVSELLPETDLSDNAMKTIEQIEMNQKVNPTVIGVVLPLTGKFANVGQRTLKGLELGLGLDGKVYSPIKLAVADSEGNPDVARRAVEKLVKEDNVIAVVGSLLSKTATAVSDQAQVMGIPNIALSQKSELTNIGDKIFRYALTSEMQVRQLVRHSINNLGIKKFAIMYPNNKFGVEFANLFWDEVLARGGSIRSAQSYDPEEKNFQPYVQRLVGTFYSTDRTEEYNYYYKIWAEKNKNSLRTKESPEDILPPVVDFDAIFIADDLKASGQIVPMLAFNNIKNIKILGPNFWNTDQVTKRLANPFNQIIFVDNIQPQSPTLTASNDSQLSTTTSQSNFVKNYTATFNESPGSFEIQGYDVGTILKEVLAKGVTTREEFTNKLSNLGSVNGALGPVYISQQREIVRQVIPLTIEGNQVKQMQTTF